MTDSGRFALRSRRVLTPDGDRGATIVINREKVEAVCSYDHLPDCPLEDLGDLVLMPGLVDTHVHINQPGRTEWEGFNTATMAAAAGGITTVVDMPLNCTPVTTTARALGEKLSSLSGQLWIDCGFWGGVVPDNLRELDALLCAGVLGVKSFTIHSGIDDFQKVGIEELREAIPIIARYNRPYLIHAELDGGQSTPQSIGRSYQSFLASRPKAWEDDAVRMMVGLAEEAARAGVDSAIHIVHLSSAQAVPEIAAAQARGVRITAESCPHYLTLCAEACPDGQTLFKCCPPIREEANRQQLWQALGDDIISFIVSDHSPCTPQLKCIDSGDLDRAWGGISSLQFGLSLIWTEAQKRNIPLSKVSQWMAERPAGFAGLGASKGQIAPGFDADFALFDDRADYLITASIIKFRHRITPYEGRRVSGVVKRTYLRGRCIYREGDFMGEPGGRPILHQQNSGATDS